MNIGNCILVAAVSTLLLTVVSGRALADFNTDRDLEAWHKFGLESFYGPWAVVARKSNGDLISYTDYGSTIPSDFRGIKDEDSYSLEVFPTGLQDVNLSSSSSSLLLKLQNKFDEKHHPETSTVDDIDKEKKPDTLELIGIVGVIENDATDGDKEDPVESIGNDLSINLIN